jgi:hypothetical protein
MRATLGGLAGLAAHETGLTDAVKIKLSEGVKNFSTSFGAGKP